MRRLFTVASVSLASAVLLIGGAATPASAATMRSSITVSGTAYILDDEPWPADDNDGNHVLRQKSLHLPTNDLLRWDPCQDGEVTADLEISAKPIEGRPGWVRVHASLFLLEGPSCDWNEINGRAKADFDVAPGTQVQKTLSEKSDEFNSDDYIRVQFTVTNWYYSIPPVGGFPFQ